MAFLVAPFICVLMTWLHHQLQFLRGSLLSMKDARSNLVTSVDLFTSFIFESDQDSSICKNYLEQNDDDGAKCNEALRRS